MTRYLARVATALRALGIAALASWCLVGPVGARAAGDPCRLEWWESLPPPIKSDQILASIDVNGDSVIDFDFVTHTDGGMSSTGYILDYFDYRNHCVVLGATAQKPGFVVGALIGLPGQEPYKSEGTFGGLFLLLQTWADECSPFGCYSYAQAGGEFADASSALVGARVIAADGPHFGWVKFVRPCNEPWVPFTPDSHALHPLPNTPIPAGVVPQPELTITRVGERVIISWPEGWQGYTLEWKQRLDPAIIWKRVDGGVSNHVTLPLDTAAGFFHLVKETP